MPKENTRHQVERIQEQCRDKTDDWTTTSLMGDQEKEMDICWSLDEKKWSENPKTSYQVEHNRPKKKRQTVWNSEEDIIKGGQINRHKILWWGWKTRRRQEKLANYFASPMWRLTALRAGSLNHWPRYVIIEFPLRFVCILRSTDL